MISRAETSAQAGGPGNQKHACQRDGDDGRFNLTHYDQSHGVMLHKAQALPGPGSVGQTGLEALGAWKRPFEVASSLRAAGLLRAFLSN